MNPWDMKQLFYGYNFCLFDTEGSNSQNMNVLEIRGNGFLKVGYEIFSDRTIPMCKNCNFETNTSPPLMYFLN